MSRGVSPLTEEDTEARWPSDWPEMARTAREAWPQTGHWFYCSWGGGRDVGDVASSNSPSARCGGGGVQRLQHARAGGDDVIPAPVGR